MLGEVFICMYVCNTVIGFVIVMQIKLVVVVGAQEGKVIALMAKVSFSCIH